MSRLFRLAQDDFFIPLRLAAKIFSLIPPTGSTLPRKVISPVMASLFFIFRWVKSKPEM
jgi:hypothetical protein